jgi:hypothetical protein
MKKVIVPLLTMAIFSTTVYAEPLSVAGSLDTTSSEFALAEKDPSQLVLRIDNWFSFYDYQSFDGTPLKFKDVKSLLKTVPENEPLLSRRTGVVIANWCFAAVAFASSMTAIAYYNSDLPHAETVFPVAALIGSWAFLGEMIMYQWHEDLFQRAVDNYNLSVMGIPIPVNRK